MGISDLKVEIAPKILWEPIKGILITDTIVTMWIVMIILIVMGLILRKKLKEVPGTFQGLAEWSIGGMYNFMSDVGGEQAKKHFLLFLTLFYTILASNWLGLIMGVAGEQTGFLRVPTSDLNGTIAFAIVAFIYFEYQGFKEHGIVGYISHFINIKALFTQGGMGVIDFFQGLLHIISEIVRPVALSLRLFGNIFGGEIVLAVSFLLIAPLIPVPFMLLEVIVGLIQAFVFAVLFLTFTVMNTTHHAHEESY